MICFELLYQLRVYACPNGLRKQDGDPHAKGRNIRMAIAAYLWLKDDGGALIKGGVDVQHRECSIEVKGFHHNLVIPTDNATGKITGTRMHSPMLIIKEFDCSSPYLYKAVATGQNLSSAEIKWYRINYSGLGEEYFNMLSEDVRIVSISLR